MRGRLLAHFLFGNYGSHQLNACNKYAWIPYSVSTKIKADHDPLSDFEKPLAEIEGKARITCNGASKRRYGY